MKMHLKLLYAVCSLTLLWVRNCDGYSSGPPQQACQNMLPSHGGQAKTENFPASLSLTSTTYTPNKKVNVKLESTGTSFTGFLLQARDSSNKLVGKFSVEPGKTQNVCEDSDANALGHVDDVKKQFVNTMWTAPGENVGTVRFHVTLVKNYATYWVDHVGAGWELTSPGSTEFEVSEVGGNQNLICTCVPAPPPNK